MKRSRSQRSPKSVRLVESKRRRQPDPSTSYATSINTDVVYRAQGDTRGRSGQEVTQAVGSSLIAHVDLSNILGLSDAEEGDAEEGEGDSEQAAEEENHQASLDDDGNIFEHQVPEKGGDSKAVSRARMLSHVFN